MNRRLSCLLGLLGVCCCAVTVNAQVLVPRPPDIPIAGTFEITEVSIDATIREQVAQVQLTQVFRNPGRRDIEVEYLFPLPEDGAIQDLVLMVDGQEMPGRVLPRDEARRIYESIVRSKRDPALLEYMGRGLYRTSVFPVPAGAERKVTLRTTWLCRSDRDVVEFAYPLSTQRFTSKPVGRLSVRVHIDSRRPLKAVYSPTHQVAVERSGDHRATVRYEERDTLPTGDFRLFHGFAEGAVGATLLSHRPGEREDGYFLMLVNPEMPRNGRKPIAKTVVFVLDRSGSMAGPKIEQAREALRFVLNNLREDDLFNIVVYDGLVESYRPELQRFNAETRADALAYVDNIRAGGMTNIDGALQTALGMLQDDRRPNYVLFLTDGLPTVGERNETTIADNARRANRVNARIFSFGVGYDVNARLLDRISGGNGGVSEYVKPDDDLEVAVSRFYSRMSSPALTNINISFSGTAVNHTYPRTLPDLFEGGQLVLVGRYVSSGPAEVRITGRVGDELYEMTLETHLASANGAGAYGFVERVWATRRIGHVIDELDLHGRNQELIDELVALSTKYGILTPYTSFLAEEDVRLTDVTGNRGRAEHDAMQLGRVAGHIGQSQRELKGLYMWADAAPAAPAEASSRGGLPADELSSVGSYGYSVDVEGRASTVRTLRQIGDKSFFRKEGRWVDSTVGDEDEADVIVIEQFSDDYFRLARGQTPELNQYLTLTEEVTVKLGSQVYRIVPPKEG